MSSPTYSPFSLDDLLAQMERPMSLLRYGDGEWMSILESAFACKVLNNQIDEPMAVKLMDEVRAGTRSVRDCLYGMQPLATTLDFAPRVGEWLATNAPDIRWVDSDVLHEANERGDIRRFVSAAQKRNMVLVGPPYLRKFPRKVKLAGMILTEASMYPHVKERLRDEVMRFQNELGAACFCISSAIASKALYFMLHNEIAGRSWYIDCGSLWDPHCGLRTRSYHSKMRPEALL